MIIQARRLNSNTIALKELLQEALLLRLYAYQVVLLIDGHARVGIGIDAYPGKEEENGYLHLLHIEGVIAVYLGYLLLHDGSEGF